MVIIIIINIYIAFFFEITQNTLLYNTFFLIRQTSMCILYRENISSGITDAKSSELRYLYLLPLSFSFFLSFHSINTFPLIIDRTIYHTIKLNAASTPSFCRYDMNIYIGTQLTDVTCCKTFDETEKNRRNISEPFLF